MIPNGILKPEHISFLLAYKTANPRKGKLDAYRSLVAKFDDLTVSKSTVNKMLTNETFIKGLRQIAMYITNPDMKKPEIPKSARISLSKENFLGINVKKIAKYCAKLIEESPDIDTKYKEILDHMLVVISEMDDKEMLEQSHIIKELHKEANKMQIHKEKLAQNQNVIDNISHLNEITDFMDKLK